MGEDKIIDKIIEALETLMSGLSATAGSGSAIIANIQIQSLKQIRASSKLNFAKNFSTDNPALKKIQELKITPEIDSIEENVQTVSTEPLKQNISTTINNPKIPFTEDFETVKDLKEASAFVNSKTPEFEIGSQLKLFDYEPDLDTENI